MIVMLSPAKSLDFKTLPQTGIYTLPDFLKEAAVIQSQLKKFKPEELSMLMGISAQLGQLNYERNQLWHPEFTTENAKQSILAFNGDVYEGLNAKKFSETELQTAQQKIRILSGLYGLLRPLDLIQPYRLEMGTQLVIPPCKNLYQFWQKKITEKLNEELNSSGHTLVNLASNEYFKAVDTKKLEAKIITPVFKDAKNGEFRVISFFAKKARGLMSRFIIENRIDDPEYLKAFDLDGYYFNPKLTKGNTWVFTREQN